MLLRALVAVAALALGADAAQLYTTGITSYTPWLRLSVETVPSLAPLLSTDEVVVDVTVWDLLDWYQMRPLQIHIGGIADDDRLQANTSRTTAGVVLTAEMVSVLRTAANYNYRLHMTVDGIPNISPVAGSDEGWAYGVGIAAWNGGIDYDGDGRVERVLFATSGLDIEAEYDADGALCAVKTTPHQHTIEARVGTAFNYTLHLTVRKTQQHYAEWWTRTEELVAMTRGGFVRKQWIDFGIATILLVGLTVVAVCSWRRYLRRLCWATRGKVPLDGRLGLRNILRYVLSPPTSGITLHASLHATAIAVIFLCLCAAAVSQWIRGPRKWTQVVVIVIALWSVAAILATLGAARRLTKWLGSDDPTRARRVVRAWWLVNLLLPVPAVALLLIYVRSQFRNYSSFHANGPILMILADYISGVIASGCVCVCALRYYHAPADAVVPAAQRQPDLRLWHAGYRRTTTLFLTSAVLGGICATALFIPIVALVRWTNGGGGSIPPSEMAAFVVLMVILLAMFGSLSFLFVCVAVWIQVRASARPAHRQCAPPQFEGSDHHWHWTPYRLALATAIWLWIPAGSEIFIHRVHATLIDMLGGIAVLLLLTVALVAVHGSFNYTLANWFVKLEQRRIPSDD